MYQIQMVLNPAVSFDQRLTVALLCEDDGFSFYWSEPVSGDADALESQATHFFDISSALEALCRLGPHEDAVMDPRSGFHVYLLADRTVWDRVRHV